MRPELLLAPNLNPRWRNLLWVLLLGARESIGPRWSHGSWIFEQTVDENEPGVHKVISFLAYAKAAGFTKGVADVRLRAVAADRGRARTAMAGWAPGQTWVVLAPGSGAVEVHKRWPAGCFSELAKLLVSHSDQTRVLVLGSPAETDLLREVLSGPGVPARQCFAIATDDFTLSHAIMAEAACVVAGCSGSAHIAAAAGARIVALYGPTNPGRTGPYSTQLRVVSAGLTCSPCYCRDFIRGCANPLCMSAITPERVFEEVLQSLSEAPVDRVPWLATASTRTPPVHQAAGRPKRLPEPIVR